MWIPISLSIYFLCLLFAYANADTMQSCKNFDHYFIYGGLAEVFIPSPFRDYVHEGQVKRNHLSWICREPRWMSWLNRELS